MFVKHIWPIKPILINVCQGLRGVIYRPMDEMFPSFVQPLLVNAMHRICSLEITQHHLKHTEKIAYIV